MPEAMVNVSRNIQKIVPIDGAVLTASSKTSFQTQFPMGMGYLKMMLRFKLSVTTTTAAGAISEGELNIIKNIHFSTGAGEVIANWPGRAFYKYDAAMSGTTGTKDAIAASTGDYYVNIPVWFVDMRTQRPNDTILDTSRYTQVSLDVSMGSLSDLFTTVGDATLAITLQVEIDQTDSPLPIEAMPSFYRSYLYEPPIDASNETAIKINKASDLSIKRFIVHSSTSGSSGVPFSGTNSDAIQDKVSFADQNGYIVNQNYHPLIQAGNKSYYSLESNLSGIEIYDFLHDGSLQGALWTGNKSKLQYEWTNQAGVVANDLVTVAYDAIRTLKM